MKSSRKQWTNRTTRLASIFALLVCAIAARAAGPWLLEDLENIEKGSALETVFYRMMDMPGGSVAYLRPAKETRPALSQLIQQSAGDANLYMLRALEDERQLDFAAAEADWKSHVDHSTDKGGAQGQLADFYERRLRPADEVKALLAMGQSPSLASEQFSASSRQRSWMSFERALKVIDRHALGSDATRKVYGEWMARYPKEPSAEARYFEYLLQNKDYSGAQAEVTSYSRKYPSDSIFPVKSQALLDYRKGSIEEGLAVYEKAFQPLWPPELVQSYFNLMKVTRRDRQMLDRSRAALAANPDDLNAMARVFFYYQQQGKLDVAQQTINEYRLNKEQRKASWKSEEVYTLARLLEDIHAYAESARYYYALYNTTDAQDAKERALAGMINLLVTAPEQPIRLGSGELSMYRDIGTMDPGPGYFNGILSLWMNTVALGPSFYEEEQKAVPYFHRACAAALLARLDADYPKSARRAELHAKLIGIYENYGDSRAVIKAGKDYLRDFPESQQRTTVGFQMADAYARTKQTEEEFAIYDSLLKELAEKANHIPLGENIARANAQPADETRATEEGSEGVDEESDAEAAPSDRSRERKQANKRAFDLSSKAAAQESSTHSEEYERVLDRYIARLVSLHRVPQALQVLRLEMDRNPNDPGIYEKLAGFLQQNELWSDQEQIYRKAMQQFPDKSWYHKLARFYLRHERTADFERLTQEVTKIFSGSELEAYFNDDVSPITAASLYLRLNQFANARFPHNMRFVTNLIGAYRRKETYDDAAAMKLLQSHWFESDGLRDEYFEYLSRRGLLAGELEKLKALEPAIQKGDWTSAASRNPAAVRFYAVAKQWTTHYEESAGALGALAMQDPADAEITSDASAVYRSLAYVDPKNTERAVAIEQNKMSLEPGNRDTLARIGDIYADRAQFDKAYPYWQKIPQTAAGDPSSYLDAATVFWDYYRFDEAMALIAKGRQQLHNDALYAYQAGAIYENERDYPKAIAEYLKGSLAKDTDLEAKGRLLVLASRRSSRALVDQATSSIADGPAPSMNAIELRVAVLDAQDRKSDLSQMLLNLVQRVQQNDMLEDLETLAENRSLEDVKQKALERQAELTHDPVRRLELRYALVRFYESKKDTQGAQRNVEALYHENPKILGVVRATVDFYWRTTQRQKAIEVLLQAAQDSYDDSVQPGLRTNFTFEAARKSTEAGDFARAKDLMTKLLAKAPTRGEYLAAMADVYARSGDDSGLRDFYLAKIDEFKKAQLGPDRIAELRRALIPALARLKDYSGAIDQYIEVINKYPEDESLTTEAALFAQRYGQGDRLAGFYTKTVVNSPKDPRWAVVLARLQTNLENYPAAIDAYGKAIAIRPDRVELRTARAGLNERLLHFDEAAADYEKLYELQYHNANWMEKVAETRARQGKADATIQALKMALIDGRPESAANQFEVARRLEGWNMLPQAMEFAQAGVKIAGNDLLTSGDGQGGARLYVRLLTRLRQHDSAYTKMLQAEAAAGSGAAPADAQGSVEQQIRAREASLRRQMAHSGLRQALKEIGATVNRYYTPEERLQYRQFLAAKRVGMSTLQVVDLLLPMAEGVDFPVEARYRLEQIMSPRPVRNRSSEAQELTTLQNHRLRFTDLGHELESFTQTLAPEFQNQWMSEAAKAYRDGDDTGNELRVLDGLSGHNGLGSLEERYFELMLANRPADLAGQAGRGNFDNGRRDRIASYVVAHGDPALAQAAIQARSTGLDPVWLSAYAGLTGLYFRDPSPNVNTAFLAALGGDDTIGVRVANAADRKQRLAGNTWFYYGSRFGEYRSVTKNGDPEDFLPANIEASPGRAAGYYLLAEYYVDNGKTPEALADFGHVLELAPDRADVHDRIAVLLWGQGKHDEAITEWNSVFDGLKKQLNTKLAPGFWSTYVTTVGHLGTRKLVPQYRDSMDSILRSYVKSNGEYQVESLLKASFSALHDPKAGVAWMMDLSTKANSQSNFLVSLENASWIPLAERDPIHQRLLELAQKKVDESQGIEKEYATNDLVSTQLTYASYLVKVEAHERAQAVLDGMPPEVRKAHASEVVPVQLQIAARLKTLDGILDNYRRDPEKAPGISILQDAAKTIQQAGDKQSARKILELAFAFQIDQHQFSAPTFLGLADIRLEAGDTAGAMELLRRMVLTTGGGFGNLDSAAALLIKHDHPAEALEFLERLVKAIPWNADFRVRLAEAQIKAQKDPESAWSALTQIAASGDTAYLTRVAASRDLAGAHRAIDLHSGELNLLAAGKATLADADHPFYYDAKMLAAQSASEGDKIRLLRSALEDWPERQPARLELFKAAVAAKQYRLAISDIVPILRGVALEGRSRDQALVDDEEDLTAENQDGYEHWTLGSLPEADRAALAAQLGEAFAGLTMNDQGLRYSRLAYRLEKSEDKKKILQARVTALRTQINRDATNAARQPSIHPALEQDHVVRPRLVAKAPPAPKASATAARRAQ